MKKSIALCCALALSAVGAGDLEAGESALRMMGASPSEERVFLAGAAQALGYANAILISKGQSPIFCMPATQVLDARAIRSAAELGLVGDHEPGVFILAAIVSLQSEYPCR